MSKGIPRQVRIGAAVVISVCSILHAGITITVRQPLPASVDNSESESFPAVVRQEGESCGNAVGIGYVFNYEMSAARGVRVLTEENQYPYFYTYAFLNGGEEAVEFYYRHFLAAWKIARENGIPTIADYGTSNLGATRWLHGYDKYYRAMCNRVVEIDSLQITDAASLNTMKQWLVDHGDGSPDGGVMILTANIYCCAEAVVPSGTPQAGDSYLKAWGWSSDPTDEMRCRTSPHALTIIGYNDSMRYDYNGDGKYTNGPSVAEWETGAVRVVNSWGTGAWDNGFIWAGYRTLALPMEEGGTRNDNYLYFMTVKKEYTPVLTFKAGITCSSRENLSLSVGAAPDHDAGEPTVIRRFERQFTYSGGSYPMQGSGASSSIEIGLDISDLIDSIGGNGDGKFFLIVTSKGGTATVDSLILMDYAADTLIRTPYPETGISIPSGTSARPEITSLGIDRELDGIDVSMPIKRYNGEREVTIRSGGGAVRIRLPFSGPVHGTLYSVSGRRISTFNIAVEDRELRLPDAIPSGIWVLTARFSDLTERNYLFSVQR
ncbi:MAG: hypothetical protein JW863_03350 [Chitinispirillaceae bacterium]|nr:hypothetical protein [Chitinispirillaceae bacterium]